jgi:hypothetical protein
LFKRVVKREQLGSPNATGGMIPNNLSTLFRDDDSMQAIYGRNVTTRSVLLGKVAAPAAAQSFLSAVKGAKALGKRASSNSLMV